MNPVEHTETSEDGGTYDPWPPNAFEHFFEYARIGLHRPVYSGLFTGQRLSDVIDMRRPQRKRLVPVGNLIRLVREAESRNASVS